MDYSLAALKLLCAQLKDAREVPSRNGFILGGILFQRAWLQGVLVSAPDGDAGPLILDDGSGLIELSLSGDFRLQPWRVGMYVMVVGGYLARTGEPPMIKVHKMVDLSSFPDREAMWYLEVLEAYKLFYQPLIEEFT
ncbi:recQ-mediated genome instability protein 2-like [Neltuma alba]|uniref:recQ-mediated genome instability protein 2 n=1 Tax=Neltuma alba TaxID=207710 RepID=UPI0010A2C0FE|nr:recQ-mediated genome instability protein 2-like [Prosopis alba]XP_028808126.1 recQ-mediated genome instability protein 2-like [Prosopis alba]